MTPSFSTMTPYDLVVLRVEFLSDMFTIIGKVDKPVVLVPSFTCTYTVPLVSCNIIYSRMMHCSVSLYNSQWTLPSCS